MDKNTSYLKDKSTISTPKGKFAYFFLSKHSKYQNITECNIKNHLQNVLSKWHWPAFPPRTPPFRARYIVVRCGNVLMYWHGDVFYGIDNATLHRCIHPAPLCSSIFLCIDISSRRHCIATTTHLQVDSEAPRPILPRQATGKLSLSSQSSSAALMTHPTPGKPPHFPL